ncbi:MAG: guanylate kinase [Flavobacteriales bacterium]|nr:guanylate kinase [Flavobacteriales bacterium]
MGKLIILSAPSGAGKTTLVKYLLEEISELTFSISCTTREKRPNEVNGKDYYFISESEFKNKIQADEFVEYEEVYNGRFYGTLNSELERIWNQGKIVIFDVDVVGGVNIKNKFPTNSLSIFIAPPSLEILAERLKNRETETQDTLKTRVEKAELEMSYANKFDKILVNDDLEQSKKEIKSLVLEFIKSK